MTRLARAPLALAALAALALPSACHPPAGTRSASGPLGFAASFGEAARVEQLEPARAAIEAHLALVDRAVAEPDAPHALDAAVAALDALTTRATPALAGLVARSALAFRTPDGVALARRRLDDAAARAPRGAPALHAAIARASLELALHEGDAAAAALWRARTGCAREATVVGPVAPFPLGALHHATAIETASAPLASSYPGVAPFASRVAPTRVDADGCLLPTDAAAAVEGLRLVAVDVDVPKAGTIWLSIRSSSAAVLVAGGREVVERAYRLGGSSVRREALVSAPAGKLRLVVRLADAGDASPIVLAALGDDGSALAMHAPSQGDLATSVPREVRALERATASDDEAEAVLVACASLADGDARAAEHLLESRAKGPLGSLVLARAIETAGDLPAVRATERSREAYETAAKAWPGSWEATLGSALSLGRRRGVSEGRFDALGALDEARRSPAADPLLAAATSVLGAEGDLPDVAATALEALTRAAGEAPIVVATRGRAERRVGPAREHFACETAGTDRGSLECFDAKAGRGELRGARAELARLRALRGSPGALAELELSTLVAEGDADAALAVYDRMRPAARSLGALGLLVPRAAAAVRERAARDVLTTRDGPQALAALSRLLGDEAAADLLEEASAAGARDDGALANDGAATLVLRHVERFDLDARGLLHYVVYDLRKVFGTTDVEQGAEVQGPAIEGREARRLLRRRVLKPDGRVIEPDRARFAEQAHADLSQLEKGDRIEQIFEGWSVPGRTGQLVVDTGDLLPERTRVLDASIELAAPAELALATWSHPTLGAAQVSEAKGRRVTTWRVRDLSPRTIEDGVARMDRDVAVSFGTSSWSLVADAMRDATLALDDADPAVARFARAARGGDDVAPRATVERVVAAAGRAVKVAVPGMLGDASAALPPGPQSTNARATLELRQGSRSWLVHRALAELGVASEIVVAERRPFSASPSFPAHFGRFDAPLVVAHLADGDVWIDADVEGPPLPAGRVSPELRGRPAMSSRGTLTEVGAPPDDGGRDEVDLRLLLDARGDAAGTVTVVLRGRAAQALADSLEKIAGSERDDLLRDVVLAWLPSASVETVALSSSEGAWQVSLRAEVRVAGLAEREGDAWVLPGLEPVHLAHPRPSATTLGATLATRKTRDSALSIDRALYFHAHRRIELPPGMTPKAPLPEVGVKTRAIEASRASRAEPTSIDEDFAVSLPTGTVDTSAYAAFVGDLRRIDDGFLARVRLAVPASAAPGPAARRRP